MKSQHQKSQVWGGRLDASPSELNIQFCSGRDVKELPKADEELTHYDIWTNLAHTEMLHKVGILSKREFTDLKSALIELNQKALQGEFTLDPAKEDIHINTEHYLTFEKRVSASQKMHTGRSRNDQVATDMRLILRDKSHQLIKGISSLTAQILKTAESVTDVMMPGFTHYQPGMLTTAAHWLTSWSQGLLRDLSALRDIVRLMNRSPLGAAASFGTSWPIDREYTAMLLGFDGVEENTLDCIASRGELESRLASAISILMNRLSTISQDLILLSTPYYGMIKIHNRFVTGSSIMPQKQNPDCAELIRGKAALAHGFTMSLLGIQKGGMSGYNRDTQPSKYLIFDLFRECEDAPMILSGVIASLTFNTEEMLNKCHTGFMNSADVADWLARKFSLSFRACYELLSLAVKYSDEAGELTLEAMRQAIKEIKSPVSVTQRDIDFLNTPNALLKDKSHTGAPSPASVKRMISNQKKALDSLIKDSTDFQEKIEQARNRCFSL